MTVFDCFFDDFDDWYTVGTLLDQQCTNSVPIRLPEQCVAPACERIGTLLVHCWTNSVPTVYQSSKTVKKSKDSTNTKNDHWCTNCHMSTQSPPNTQSPRSRPSLPNTQSLSKRSEPFSSFKLAQGFLGERKQKGKTFRVRRSKPQR